MATPDMCIIPQAWAEGYEPLPDGWLVEHAPGLVRHVSDIAQAIDAAARAGNVSAKLLVTRAQIEQSAITYAWDGSTRDYGGGLSGETIKLNRLTGADITDSGPRAGAWTGYRRQLLATALRFGYWYRGLDGPLPEHRNWLGLAEDTRYRAGVAVTRAGVTIVPANQASADCLRYTTSMAAQAQLREWGMRWWPEDYAAEEERQMADEQQMTLRQMVDYVSTTPVSRSIDRVIVHHTWRPTAADYRGIATVAGVRRYHVQSRGWTDNGYHMMVAPDGALFRCRPLARIGAHTTGQNANSIGLSFIADFDAEDPLRYQGIAPAVEVVRACMVRWNIPTNRVFGHRAFAAKSCPGSRFDIGWFRSLLAAPTPQSEIATMSGRRVKVVAHPGPEPNTDGLIVDGTTYAPVRDVAAMLGGSAVLGSDGKVYVRR